MALKRTLKVAIIGGLTGACLLAGYEVFYWFRHVYEDDARIRTELTKISAQVDGKIQSVLVEEGSRIVEGQELFHLVDDEIRLALAALRTDLALKQAERKRLMSEKAVFEAELASKLETQTQKIRAIREEHAAIKDRLALSEKNLARVKFLLGKNLTSEERYIAEKDKMLALRGDTVRTRAAIAVAESEYEQLEASARQIDVIFEQISIADLEQTRIRDDIRLQEIALAYRRILSPIDGVVGRIHRYAGEYVEDGVTVMMLHDPGRYWIEAYVDESQMRHVRVGQDVLIELEIYPFQDYYGTVSRIGNATTAELGLPTRGSGSRFGTDIGRVPVRITLDDPPPNLTPGMRASVNIRIYQRIKLW